MKHMNLLVTSCLGFILLTAMVNHKHHDPMSSWVKLSGSDGKDICVNEKGEFILVNTVGKQYRYVGPNWKENTHLKNVKVYEENKGIRAFFHGSDYWVIHDCAKFRQTDAQGREYWDESNIAIGSDSTIWNLISNNISYARKCGIKTKLPGPSISRIAAGGGQVWMIDKQGKIYQLKDPRHIGMGWEQKPGGGGRDITVTNDGYVFLVNNQGRIFKWTGFRWDQLDGSDGLRIAANNRKILLINTDREIYTRNY